MSGGALGGYLLPSKRSRLALKVGQRLCLYTACFTVVVDGGGTHTPDAPRMPPPLHRSSNVVCDCSSEIEPVSLHTAAAYHLEPPEPAPATPIRVDNSHSDKTVWRRPPVVSQTVFASVHVYSRKTHARTGAHDFSTCIRDRMQRQIGACRAHQTPPRRIWASAGSMSSSPSRWSLTFANRFAVRHKY